MLIPEVVVRGIEAGENYKRLGTYYYYKLLAGRGMLELWKLLFDCLIIN